MGDRAIATDFSPARLEKAKAKLNAPKLEFRAADLSKPWNVPDGTEDLPIVFQEAARVSRPSGKLFVGELHPVRQYLGSRAEIRDASNILKATGNRQPGIVPVWDGDLTPPHTIAPWGGASDPSVGRGNEPATLREPLIPFSENFAIVAGGQSPLDKAIDGSCLARFLKIGITQTPYCCPLPVSCSLDRRSVRIPSYVHHISECIKTAERCGFSLECLKEWWRDRDKNQPTRRLSLLWTKS